MHRWEATEHAIYSQSGWLLQERRIAPISRVPSPSTCRTRADHPLLGLASVTVDDGLGGGSASRSPGLDLEVAAQARRLPPRRHGRKITQRGDAT